VLPRVGQSLRHLRRDLRFTLPALTVLALAFALGAATFSVVRVYLLRPLPFPDADRVMAVDWSGDAHGARLPAPLATVDWRQATGLLEQAVSVNRDIVTLSGTFGAEQLFGVWVSANFFEVFGGRMAAGRALSLEAASASEVVISHAFWESRFHSEPAVVGSTVRVDTLEEANGSRQATVVGVLPSDFWAFDRFFDVLLLESEPVLPTFVRLRPGVSPSAAATAFTAAALAAGGPGSPDWRVSVEPLRQRVTARIRPILAFLLAGATLVLLVAAANVTVLYLVQLDRRRADLAVRRALGAWRSQIAAQLTAEMALLTGAATLLGLGVSRLF
jgi:putative ABC transport system permease protein